MKSVHEDPAVVAARETLDRSHAQLARANQDLSEARHRTIETDAVALLETGSPEPMPHDPERAVEVAEAAVRVAEERLEEATRKAGAKYCGARKQEHVAIVKKIGTALRALIKACEEEEGFFAGLEQAGARSEFLPPARHFTGIPDFDLAERVERWTRELKDSGYAV